VILSNTFITKSFRGRILHQGRKVVCRGREQWILCARKDRQSFATANPKRRKEKNRRKKRKAKKPKKKIPTRLMSCRVLQLLESCICIRDSLRQRRRWKSRRNRAEISHVFSFSDSKIDWSGVQTKK
jgi:hypothetical protein